jgi:hypothetical protein
VATPSFALRPWFPESQEARHDRSAEMRFDPVDERIPLFE